MTIDSPLFQVPPHARLADFLGAPNAETVIETALTNLARFAPSSLVDNDGTRTVQPTRRRSSTLMQPPVLTALFRDAVTARLPEILTALGVRPFPVRHIEVQLTAHADGGFFGRHIDTVHAAHDLGMRQISVVYYAHRRPRAFTGGALRLYAIAGAEYVDIEPVHDTLVAFPSWVPHEVLPVHCPSDAFEDSRFAMNVWVHS